MIMIYIVLFVALVAIGSGALYSDAEQLPITGALLVGAMQALLVTSPVILGWMFELGKERFKEWRVAATA
jgi:hypothetical protein